MGWNHEPGHREGRDRDGHGDEEHRTPPEVIQQHTGDQRAYGRACRTDGRPQRDRLGAGGTTPEGSDQRERRGVAHAAGDATEDAGADQEVGARCPRREAREGYRQDRTEEQHLLAAVAVTDRAEIQDGGRESQAVADGDEVQLGLRGVEIPTDRRQRDIGDGEVQVGHCRSQDQGDQNQRSVRWPTRLRLGSRSCVCHCRLDSASSFDISQGANWSLACGLQHDVGPLNALVSMLRCARCSRSYRR